MIRSFPISTLTKEKLVKLQYTPHIDQLPKEGLQLRACIFQVRTPINYQYWQSAIRSDETDIQIHCYEQADIIQLILYIITFCASYNFNNVIMSLSQVCQRGEAFVFCFFCFKRQIYLTSNASCIMSHGCTSTYMYNITF